MGRMVGKGRGSNPISRKNLKPRQTERVYWIRDVDDHEPLFGPYTLADATSKLYDLKLNNTGKNLYYIGRK